MVQKSLKLFLLGLLLWLIFINLVGFINPFWAMFILENGMRSNPGIACGSELELSIAGRKSVRKRGRRYSITSSLITTQI